MPTLPTSSPATAAANPSRAWRGATSSCTFHSAATPCCAVRGRYPMFGRAQWMPVRWCGTTPTTGALCQVFFQERLTDLGLFARLAHPWRAARSIARCRRCCETAGSATGRNDAADARPGARRLNRGLRDRLDADALAERIEHHPPCCWRWRQRSARWWRHVPTPARGRFVRCARGGARRAERNPRRGVLRAARRRTCHPAPWPARNSP